MILILNCGSQSIKWKLFDNNLKVLKENKKNVLSHKYGDYEKALAKEFSVFKKKDIRLVGHRVVHGGDKFRKPIKITQKDLKAIEKLNDLAPLHNPFNVLGIKMSQKVLPNTSQIAVFDTEFYADLPDKASVYPLPEKISLKYGFKRYGFHGISHEYVANKGAGKDFKSLKIITCHLGGGSSITAIKNGKAVDTSMGFTPMEGLTMMNRTGDIDPGIILKLSKDYSSGEMNKIMNFESGLKGISGSSNMLEILSRVKKGQKKAELALKLFVYKIQKYIGAYFAALNGCDLLIFTGTIGYGSKKIRDMICNDLDALKIKKIIAIKTDEELAIAKKITNFK